MSDACGLCGRDPATGTAFIGDVRYCHGDHDPTPTCYMQRSYPSETPLLDELTALDPVIGRALLNACRAIADAADRELAILARRVRLEELGERVAVLLVDDPQASANAVWKALGGSRAEVQDAVRRLRGGTILGVRWKNRGFLRRPAALPTMCGHRIDLVTFKTTMECRACNRRGRAEWPAIVDFPPRTLWTWTKAQRDRAIRVAYEHYFGRRA